MKKIYTLIIVGVLLLISSSLFSQNTDPRQLLGRLTAEKDLAVSLSGVKVNNIINPKSTLIKTNKTAIAVAESLLFGIYGEKTILNQKPYEVHHIDSYWVLRGTPNNAVSGSGGFLIILDDRDGSVIRMDYLK